MRLCVFSSCTSGDQLLDFVSSSRVAVAIAKSLGMGEMKGLSWWRQVEHTRIFGDGIECLTGKPEASSSNAIFQRRVTNGQSWCLRALPPSHAALPIAIAQVAVPAARLEMSSSFIDMQVGRAAHARLEHEGQSNRDPLMHGSNMEKAETWAPPQMVAKNCIVGLAPSASLEPWTCAMATTLNFL